MNRRLLIVFRIILGILILMNLYMIYQFSAEDSKESSQSSATVTEQVAEIVVPDFEKKTESEKKEIVRKMDFPIRKLAHMTEFGTLGALMFLFLSTWENLRIFLRYICTVAFVFLNACGDEWHQKFSDGRSPQVTDVLIDTSGGILFCAALWLLFFFIQRHRRTKKW